MCTSVYVISLTPLHACILHIHPPGSRPPWLYAGNDERVVGVLRGPSLQAEPEPNVVCLETHGHVLRMGDHVGTGGIGGE